MNLEWVKLPFVHRPSGKKSYLRKAAVSISHFMPQCLQRYQIYDYMRLSVKFQKAEVFLNKSGVTDDLKFGVELDR